MNSAYLGGMLQAILGAAMNVAFGFSAGDSIAVYHSQIVPEACRGFHWPLYIIGPDIRSKNP